MLYLRQRRGRPALFYCNCNQVVMLMYEGRAMEAGSCRLVPNGVAFLRTTLYCCSLYCTVFAQRMPHPLLLRGPPTGRTWRSRWHLDIYSCNVVSGYGTSNSRLAVAIVLPYNVVLAVPVFISILRSCGQATHEIHGLQTPLGGCYDDKSVIFMTPRGTAVIQGL